MADKDFPDMARMYRGSIDESVQPLIDEITQPPFDWNFQKFKNSMLAMAIVGSHTRFYIPAHHRPESIEIGPLRKYIDEIRNLTNRNGREFGRTFFIDIQGHNFIAGKKTEGTETEVKMSWKQPDGYTDLRRLFTIHGHPSLSYVLPHGMSAADYSNFITDKSEMFKIIVWGNYTMLALKTSATPNNISPDRAREKVEQLDKEAFADPKSPHSNIVDFNKLVCLEFGMTLYLVGKNNPGIARRVNVV